MISRLHDSKANLYLCWCRFNVVYLDIFAVLTEISTLSCQVSVTPASNFPTNESRLIVPASKVNAFYSCQATNSLGTDSYNVTLHRLGMCYSFSFEIHKFASSLVRAS